MARSDFGKTSSSPKKSLDVFPNSGHVYEIETQTDSEKKAQHIINNLIDTAIKLATKTLHDEEKVEIKKEEVKEEKKSTNHSPLNFFVIGCGENYIATKKRVADLMDEVARNEGKKPDFIVILGDNFKDSGLDSPVSEEFKTGFDDVYHTKTLHSICGIPCFIVPGNHDHGFPVLYPWRITGINNDLKKIENEVLRTYINKQTGTIDPQKTALFSGPTLNLGNLKKQDQTWNMPGRYYGLTHGDNTELFFIDSNTYAKEYIEFFLKGNKDFTNQPAWLESIAKNPDSLKLLFLHHSLKPKGKRASGFCPDTEEYLTPEDIKLLIEHKIIKDETANYNDILNNILLKQGLHFSTVFAAHDHCMYHHCEESLDAKTTPFYQMVVAGAGGGGHEGELQNRFIFDKNTPCFIKRRGFVSVQIPADPAQPVLFDYRSEQDPELKLHGIPGHHLQFRSNDPKPRKQHADEPGVEQLKKIVLTTCDAYLKNNPPPRQSIYAPYYISKSQWGFVKKAIDSVPDDAFFSDDLKNHFNRFEANSFEQSICYLNHALAKCLTLRALFFTQPCLLANNISYEQFINLPIKTLQHVFITGKMPAFTETKEIETKSLPQTAPATGGNISSSIWNFISSFLGFIPGLAQQKITETKALPSTSSSPVTRTPALNPSLRPLTLEMSKLETKKSPAIPTEKREQHTHLFAPHHPTPAKQAPATTPEKSVSLRSSLS